MTTRTYLDGSSADDFVFDTATDTGQSGAFVLPEPEDEVIVHLTRPDPAFESADAGDGAVQDDGPTCDPSANPIFIVVANQDFWFNE